MTTKSNLHPNNKHKKGYNFKELCEAYPLLQDFVFVNSYNTETIDFANPKAVKAINTALLFKYYNIQFWDFPDDNLCPPIPGRVDYIHYLNDLLKSSGIENNITMLDIGVGANCIYPLLGNSEYKWNFIGTDIDKKSLDRAEKIIKKNGLSEVIKLKQQKDAAQIFQGILNEDAKFSATICNPPFYKSQEDAMLANARKLEGLGNNQMKLEILAENNKNFGTKEVKKHFYIHIYMKALCLKHNVFGTLHWFQKKKTRKVCYLH